MNDWIKTLPADTYIFARDDWTGAQTNAVFAKVAADRADYYQLLDALVAVDETLGGVSDDCARDNMPPAMIEGQLGYWREMRRYLASSAGQIWESENRDLNAEIGMTIY